ELLEQAHREEIAPRELLDPLLMPMDTAVEDLPEVNLIPELADMVQHGQPVQVLGAPEQGALRLTMGEERLFIGVGEMNDDGKIAPKRLVVFRDEE
ncbi:tRNA pseudouridine(55) synthase TruB, partial [Vibrio parahaemolyticus]